MAKRSSIPVSPEILKRYETSNKDQLWAQLLVSKLIVKSDLNWTNHKEKLKEIFQTAKTSVGSRFDSRFPRYSQDFETHYVEGRSFWNLKIWLTGVYFSILILAFFLVFFGFLGFFLGYLLLGSAVYAGLLFLVDALEIEPGIPQELVDVRNGVESKLEELLAFEAITQVRSKFYESSSSDPKQLLESVNRKWQPLGPRPVIPSSGLSPREAEIYVTEYLKFYGAQGAAETRFSRDGGIDVRTLLFAAQVKHQESNVGVKAIRELYAVANVSNKQPVFFSKVGYSKEAIDFANTVKMPLFTYVPHLKSSNAWAEMYLKFGMEKVLT